VPLGSVPSVSSVVNSLGFDSLAARAAPFTTKDTSLVSFVVRNAQLEDRSSRSALDGDSAAMTFDTGLDD
jgi:hypothetical protein